MSTALGDAVANAMRDLLLELDVPGAHHHAHRAHADHPFDPILAAEFVPWVHRGLPRIVRIV